MEYFERIVYFQAARSTELNHFPPRNNAWLWTENLTMKSEHFTHLNAPNFSFYFQYNIL